MARLAYQVAQESAQVTADVVEVLEFPYLAERYHVHGVPKTIINETVSLEGAVPEPRFIDALLRAVHGG
ncbi:MAG: thioredoxin family protein [Dehalococcoidia bacterium]|nr:thioredoxin family protein [Dehalococcoidia bacterium]